MQRIRNPFVVPRLVAFMSLWLALVVSRSAHAGTYSVTYSGGQVVVTSSSGTPSTYPYYLNGNNWGGGGTGYWPRMSGQALCQNQITATFTWQPATPDDVPPQSAIVVESSSASYNLAGSAANQSCADGFGDAASGPNSSSQTSSGVRYTVKPNPGASFNVTCTPDVNVAGPGYPIYGYATVSVAYNAAAVPVEIILNGTTRFNNTDAVLIGQGVNVSLSAGGYPQSGWQWTISGDPFAGFVTTATSGNAVELKDTDKQKASLTYFYRSVSGASSTVTCSATITLPDGKTPSVTATKSINVMKPTFQFTPTKGTTNLWVVTIPNPPNPPTSQLWLEPFNPTTKQGIVFAGTVTTPSGFIGESSGIWGIAQLITPSISFTGPNAPAPITSLQGLDGVFLYANASGPANGTITKIGDTPGILLNSNSFTGVDDSNKFQSYFLYQPPASTGGTGVTWVPLQEIDWDWHGVAIFDGVDPDWRLGAASNGVNITTNTRTTTLPTWTRVITAH